MVMLNQPLLSWPSAEFENLLISSCARNGYCTTGCDSFAVRPVYLCSPCGVPLKDEGAWQGI